MASSTPHIAPARQRLVQQLLLPDAHRELPAGTVGSSAFAAALRQLGTGDRQRAQLVLDLADVSQDNEPVVHALVADPNVQSLRDVALHYNTHDLAALPLALASDHTSPDGDGSTATHAPAGATTKSSPPPKSPKPAALTGSAALDTPPSTQPAETAGSAATHAPPSIQPADAAAAARTASSSSGQSGVSAATPASGAVPSAAASPQRPDKTGPDAPVTPASTHSTLGVAMASQLRRKLFAKEPTAVLHKMTLDKDLYSGDHDLNDAAISFFAAHPDFNIREQSIVPLLTKPSGTVLAASLSKSTADSLKSLQRVQALTSDPAAIPVLLSAGVTSANQVAALPRSQFLSRVKLSKDAASDIHRHATDSVIRSNMALTTALQHIRGTGIRAIDGVTTRKERIQAAKQLALTATPQVTATSITSGQRSVINLEQLFGSMDYCDCSQCSDVTSPASYFVELLQYLRNNNLGGDVGSAAVPQTSGWAGSALEKLFRRRPDLADLELTCANTNTVLPYIDLSNEIMESFVVHLSKYISDTHVPKQATIDVFNMAADDDSAQLIAQPRNVNYEAYCILKDAVYPFTLPYNQPIDEMRILLGFLNTSRAELMSTFRIAPQPGTPDLPDSEIALNRAVTAEQLLLTQEDYIILTMQAFYSKTYFEHVLSQPNMSDTTYQTNIGVMPPYAYWGYTAAQANDITNADEGPQLGLTFVKVQFLPRSGIAYTDLVALVQTQYVNPDWPKGWVLAMLEKIRYSYAFLYSLIDKTKATKEAQLAPVVAWLAKWQPVAEMFEEMRAQYLKNLSNSNVTSEGDKPCTHKEPHGNACSRCWCECECCSDCIWSCWVLHYFELFGQLVVLDSRDGPVFGTEGWLVLEKLPPPPPQITIRSVAAAPRPEFTAVRADEEVDTVIGYLNRDGTVTTTSDTGTVTQIGHVIPDGTLIYDSSGKTFVQQYALDDVSFEMVIQSVDQTTTIGFINPATDRVELYAFNTDGTRNSEAASTPVQWGPIQDDCDLDKVRLIHLDGSQILAPDYGRFQRFIRLWLKLGWTMDQLDQALTGLASVPSPLETTPGGTDGAGGTGGSGTSGSAPPFPSIPAITWGDLQDKCPGDTGSGDGGDDRDCGDHRKCCCSIHGEDLWSPPAPLEITPDFLDQLAAVQQLQAITGLNVSQLLVFWAGIGTHSGSSPSLYQQLFLTTGIIALDPVFEADANGNYLSGTKTLSAHAQAVMAALKIHKPADLAMLVSVAKVANDKLTLENLSALFRYKLLANVLSIAISQLPSFISVFGDPFAGGAIRTLQIVTDWTNVSNSGFALPQLSYIITGVDSQTHPMNPSQLSIFKTCKTLVDGLSNILTSYPDPSSTTPMTSDTVALYAGLLYDSQTVTAINGVLTGSSMWTTNAPMGLKLKIPDPLSKKLVYTDSPATSTNAASATVSSTGILTANEAAASKSLVTGSGAKAWGEAIDRLLKQPGTWFQITISGVFPDSAGAISTLLSGDVPASTPADSQPADPTNPPPAPDPGTAPGKTLYFLTYFMPFLRTALEQQLVTDTMTGVSSLSNELTALLLTDILRVPANPDSYTTRSSTTVSAMSSLMGLLKEPTGTPTSSWSGYLIAPTTDAYTLLATGDTQPASITLGGSQVSFPHQQADPNNIWLSDPVNLTAGLLIPLTDPTGPATQLKWQTPRSPASSIPSSALLPGYATAQTAAVFVALVKAGLVISTFNLTVDEVAYFQQHGSDFDTLDFNAVTLKSWKRLSAYVTLRQSLQGASITLISLFEWAVANSGDTSAAVGTATIVNMIVAATAWDPIAIAAAIDPVRFNLVAPSAYRNEVALAKLSKALTVFTKVGGGGGAAGAIDMSSLFSWARPLIKFEACRAVAATIRHTIRSRYDLASWEQAVQPLNNKLREDQKNALIAYLLVQPVLRSEGIIDADSLFEFFLIDVQMSSCLQTSRIKQAISTVQVFIQRCLLGLELDENGNPITVDASRWVWMSKYVLWQADRTIFLYPENYLVPSLRDDKSPFYTQLESSLNQKTVDSAAVSTAFKNYFYDVDLAANLLVKGLFLELPTSQTSTLHIISCTRHTPQAYYYRQLQVGSISQIWTPWELMNVDIPTYTVEATSGSSSSAVGTVTSTGSYVTPVVWNGRIFVLFPTFAKKTLPSKTYTDTTKTIHDQADTKNASAAAAPSYWYITMNLSERRDGIWAPKQVSTEGVYEDIASITDATTMPPINTYAFIPRIVGTGDTSSLSIDVLRQSGSSLLAIGRFDFVNGRIVRSQTAAAGGLSFADTLDFGTDMATNQTHSWQSSSLTNLPEYLGTEPYAYYPSGMSSGEVQLAWKIGQSPDLNAALPMTNFYHPFVHQILARLSITGKLADVFSYYDGLSRDQLSDAYGGNPQTLYDEQSQPYALYNWEPGLYALWELASQLYAQSQFDQALDLCRFIFNPMANSNKVDDAWLFPPFRYIVAKDYLENFFNNLQPGQPNFSITEWRNNAFDPFVVARSRPVTFMKAIVMLYLNILIAYGDYYFRQNTLETVPYAIQMYVIASHIYGKPGQKIPMRGKTKAQTYRTLSDRFDAFDNAVTDLELMFPFSNQIQSAYPIGFTGQLDTPVNLPNIFGSATTHYFCIPQNAQQLQIRATIDDRLFKLRHCQDINGVVQKLPLFDPPLDIAALVAATAEGLSISSFLNDLDSPMPNYRFYFLLQKAHEVVAELRSLLDGYLSIKEKGDGVALDALRQTHECNLNKAILDVKNRTIDEATATKTQLMASADVQRQRLGHVLNLLGMDTSTIPKDESQTFSEVANIYEKPADDGGLMLTSSESDQMDKAGTARDLNIVAGINEAISAIFMALPTVNADGKPLGVGVTMCWGFPSLGQAASATSRGIKVVADYLTAQSSLAGLRTSYLKQRQERVQEANSAGYELNNINQQINVQTVRIDVATKDATSQQTALDNSQEVVAFLQTKYTNQQLYTWLDQQTAILTHSAYTVAYDLAKRVEKAYQFERPLDTQTYVQYGYWDDSHSGLLAGTRLSSALRQIEAAYQSTRGYDYEITKSVSLRLTHPMQLLTLRQTGSCQFDLPEVLFDMDFPGHYLRRIKSVSLTMPCVTGPYTSVSCTLRLISHTYRTSPIAKGASDYARHTDGPDSRFATTNLPISAIATSTCQGDAGVFDIDFRSSERYLPFEGAGAISTWSLQLPASFRQFDYATIADTIMTVRYTAVEGGDLLKAAASASVAAYIKSVDDLASSDGLFMLWDLKAEFATGFYRIANPPAPGSDLSQRILPLPNLDQTLPVFAMAAKKITAVDIFLVSTTPLPVNALSIAPVTTNPSGATTVGDNVTFTQDAAIGALAVYQALDADMSVRTWQLAVADGAVTLDRVWLAIRYTLG